MRKLKKETIDRIVVALKEMQSEMTRGSFNNLTALEICKKHKTGNNLLGSAIKCGVFTKIGRNKYKCNIAVIEPFHARKILERRKQYYMKKKQLLMQKAVQSTNKKVVKRPYVKKQKQVSQEQGSGFFRFIRDIFGLNN
jgi:hypothetical protein